MSAMQPLLLDRRRPAPRPSGTVQRRCACGDVPGPTGECAACRRKRLLEHPADALAGFVMHVGQKNDIEVKVR